MPEAEHDYVEYELDVENGQVTGCRFFGEGKQVDPLDGVKVYVPAGEVAYPSFFERIERRLKHALRNL